MTRNTYNTLLVVCREVEELKELEDYILDLENEDGIDIEDTLRHIGEVVRNTYCNLRGMAMWARLEEDQVPIKQETAQELERRLNNL